MRQLRLVGLAEDGASLMLETPTGDAFRLPVDDRVRAACRGDLTRLGQIEIEMDNPLRPREIQARVRAGESAEEVAASSGMPLDRVLRFASPMLQERERVVAQARATPLRPRGSQTLAELVEDRLVGRGTDASTLRWDAWRREDGRWTVRLSWRHAAGHAASWTFDLAARTLHPDDPAAEQLGAEEFHARTITAVTPLAVAARDARAPAQPGSPARPGAGAHPGAAHPAGAPADPGSSGRSRSDGPAGAAGRAGPAAAGGGPHAERGVAERGGSAAAAGGRRTGGSGRSRSERRRPDRTDPPAGHAEADPADDEPAPVDPPRRVASAGGGADLPLDGDDERGRRTSVPSWDDILLGVRRRH